MFDIVIATFDFEALMEAQECRGWVGCCRAERRRLPTPCHRDVRLRRCCFCLLHLRCCCHAVVTAIIRGSHTDEASDVDAPTSATRRSRTSRLAGGGGSWHRRHQLRLRPSL